MNSVLVIVDGLGDDPISCWDNKTPFSKAKHPQIDKLIELGNYNEISISEEDIKPESLGCILRLLGLPTELLPHNRAYFELLTKDRNISEYEMVLRCNLVSVDDENKMISFNAMGLSEDEKNQAAEMCSNILSDV